MSNFEKITASLETLGDFLASLKAADTPWEDAFHKTFCTECGRDNCDEKPCPFQKERDNPTWWLFQTADGEQEADKDSEREFLIREYERSKLDRIVRLPDGKPANCGTCVCFSAWMNGKGPDGKALRSVEKVILPTVTEYVRNGYRDCPMVAELVFGRIEDAAELTDRMGQRCKLEIRAAVQNWDRTDAKWEINGHSHIMECVPAEIEQAPLAMRGGTELTVRLLVYQYTAVVNGKKLWDFRYRED